MGLNYHLGGLGTVREIDKLDDITYCGIFAKLRLKKKTLFRLFLAATCVWCGGGINICVLIVLRLFYQIKY